MLSPIFAATSIMTIDNMCFRSPKLKEISPVGPLLLMCLLLPYPALGTELKRDPTRSYATPCMNAILLRSYDTSYFLLNMPSAGAPTGTRPLPLPQGDPLPLPTAGTPTGNRPLPLQVPNLPLASPLALPLALPPAFFLSPLPAAAVVVVVAAAAAAAAAADAAGSAGYFS